jgi:4-hydroxyphenylpyruvate dioxygenase
VTDFFGSGVQHIALRTADIRATVSMLRAGGVDMLPVPENYYDDLEVRTDLPPGEIEALKKLDILYDRDASGTFLHAYTTSLDGGFFFEIVQRQGYAGYGAANAGVRLSVQTNLAQQTVFPDA